MSRRVVVTGQGIVSPIGSGVPEVLEAVREGRSGVGRIQAFDPAPFTSQIAAEVPDFAPAERIDPKLVRRADRFVQFALVAADMALEDSGLEITDKNAPRVGVVWGSGIGGMITWEEQYDILREKGPGRISPFFVPMMIANMGAGMVSIATGAKGPNTTTVTACASSAHALGDAFEIIRRNDADAMITGGSEASVSRTALGGFCAARALSRRNDDPTRACRPFDRDRDGFVMGEGGAGLILEELEFARARGARIVAEVIGYGMSGDAYHITAPAPDGQGPINAMRAALKEAELGPEDVDAISAHGPGTPGGDEVEAAAIQTVFANHRERPLVTSTKPMHGHQLGAVGATEALICCLMLEHKFVPGTLNHEEPSDGIELNIVAQEAVEADVNVTMSNSFGFGGHNAVLLFRSWNGE